jgi:cytochrome c oxidase subunit 1
LWERTPDDAVVTGLRNDRREVLVTELLDAEPQHRYVIPGPSIWPLLAAIGSTIGLIGSVFNPWYLWIGAVLGGIGLIGWFWPPRDRRMLYLEENR